MGENSPLVAIRGGANPITLGVGSQVYSRFSLNDKKSALISNDWVVGVNSTAVFGAWAFTLEAYHESSHLGDEYEDRFGAKRPDWTRDLVGACASYSLGHGGSWAAATGPSRTSWSSVGRAAPSGSTSGRRCRGRGTSARSALPRRQAATGWRVSSSLAGDRAPAVARKPEIGLAIVAHDGLST